MTAGQPSRNPAPYPGLLAAVMAAVRPEFRADVLGFDPRDPVFGGPPCLVAGCERAGRIRGLCVWHIQQWYEQKKPDFAGFVAAADPQWRPRSVPAACRVPGCRYAAKALGLCKRHACRYRYAGSPDLAAWTSGASVPRPDPPIGCLVPGCGLWARPDVSLCHAHAEAWSRAGCPDPREFADAYGDEEKLGRERISLLALGPQLRLEWQYALQCRSDAARQRVRPAAAQRAVTVTARAGVTSLLDWDEERWERHWPWPGQPGTSRQLIIYARRLAEDLAFGRGWDVEYPRDTWRLRKLGVNDRTAHLRFGGIPQPWLKDLAKRWCRWRLSTGLNAATPARGAAVLTRFAAWLAGPGACPGIAGIDRPLLERYLAGLHAELGGRAGLLCDHIENLNSFITAVRQHGWAPELPASAMIFPGDYPKRGKGCPGGSPGTSWRRSRTPPTSPAGIPPTGA